jgi:hypothetical protein
VFIVLGGWIISSPFSIIRGMKKYLLILTLFLSNLLFAQSEKYHKINFITEKYWVSDMVWNNTTNEFDFIDRAEPDVSFIEWHMLIDKEQKTGTIKAGNVAYDIITYSLKNQDGLDIVSFEVTNIKLKKTMKLLLTQKDGDMLVGLYDLVGRTAYYFD